MKKLLIATLLIAGLTSFAPNASADHKKHRKDHCEQPVYQQSYRSNYGSYQERPIYYREVPQVRYRSYDYDDRPCYREQRRHVSPLSFIFGF